MNETVDKDAESSSVNDQPVDQVYTPASNPLRTPTWRWDRIIYMTSSAGKPRKAKPYDDKLIVDGRRYMLRYNEVVKLTTNDTNTMDMDHAFNTLYVQYPAISMAHKIYVTRNFARYAIESMVLARQSPADIAKELGCPPSVVETYEFIFYDVRDRLDNNLYIMDALLSPALKHGMAGTDYDFLWKSVAYTYGLSALKAMWSLGAVDESTKTQLADMMKTMTERTALRAMAIRQPTQHNAHDIISEVIDRADVEARAKQPLPTAEKSLLEGINVIANAIQLCVASSTVTHLTAREPRANQLVGNVLNDCLLAEEVQQPDGTWKDTRPIEKQQSTPPEPELSVFNRPTGAPQNSNSIGNLETRIDIKEKKDLILNRIRGKVKS